MSEQNPDNLRDDELAIDYAAGLCEGEQGSQAARRIANDPEFSNRVAKAERSSA